MSQYRFLNYRLKYILLVASLCICLTGCPMVGPDFQKPPAPKSNNYLALPLPSQTVATPKLGTTGQAQRFIPGQDIPAQWWSLYRSPLLNKLICQAFANSPNLAAAKATLAEAQQSLMAQVGSSLYPSLSGSLSGSRQNNGSFPSSTGSDTTATAGLNSNVFNLYNATVAVSYTLDIFGGLHRQIEALAAQVDYQRFQLEGAYLSLSANIVTSVVSIASLEAQIRATHELIRAKEEQLLIIKKQLKLGGVSGTNVLSQETQVAQTRALLPPLEQNLAQTQHALAVLVGRLPSDMKNINLNFNQLSLPTRLPLSLPSQLVQQRPDIRASEALLKAASAQIGVATANLFPQINLTGSYGYGAIHWNKLFNSNNHIWGFGGQLTQPIFQGGSLLATRRAAIEAYQAALAQYQQTVLQAFQNVADSLRAIENDAKALQAQSAAETAAYKTLSITAKQFNLGGVSYLNLLSAQQQYQQAKINRIQAEAARYADTAALFQALGGGWWNRSKELPVPKDTQQTRTRVRKS